MPRSKKKQTLETPRAVIKCLNECGCPATLKDDVVHLQMAGDLKDFQVTISRKDRDFLFLCPILNFAEVPDEYVDEACQMLKETTDAAKISPYSLTRVETGVCEKTDRAMEPLLFLSAEHPAESLTKDRMVYMLDSLVNAINHCPCSYDQMLSVEALGPFAPEEQELLDEFDKELEQCLCSTGQENRHAS